MKSEDLVRTIAHELGHGAFGLEHTFDPEYGIDDRYNNLMGYGKGDTARLFKFQWDIAHNSKAGEDEFEDAEDVMEKRKSNFKRDENYEYCVGYDKILDYLISKKKEEFKETVKNNSYNGKSAKQASWILEDILGRKNIKIGDEDEALRIVNTVALYIDYEAISTINDKIETYILKNTNGQYPKEYVRSEIIRETTGTFFDFFSEMYENYFEFQKLKSLQGIDQIKLEIIQNFIQGASSVQNASILITQSGFKELISGMSNTKFKQLLRNYPKIINSSELARLVKVKNNLSSSDVRKLLELFEPKDIKRVLTEVDDIHFSNWISKPTNYTENFAKKAASSIGKFGKLAKLAGPIVNFALFVNELRHPENISPADILGVPFIKLEIDRRDIELGEFIVDVSGWEFILDYERVWKGKHGIPNTPLYFYYAENTEKFNPLKQPTSIVFLNLNIAKDVFGFEPKYINYDFKNYCNFTDNRLLLLPRFQTKIKWTK